MDSFSFNALLIATIYTLCVVPFANASSSQFVTLPQSQAIVEGDSVVFACEATPHDELQYSWTHNGQIIKNSSRVYQSDSDLQIDAVQRDTDAGDYVCIATIVASGARQASPPARLSVIWIQTASVQMLSNLKNAMVLKCHVEAASGDGMLEIEWYRNSEKLATIQNVQLQENRLIIRNPTAKDNGLYRCIASNAAGKVMSKKGFVLSWSSEQYNGQYGAAIVSSCIPRLKKNQKLPPGTKNEVLLCRGKRGGSGGILPDNEKFPVPTNGDIRIIQGPAGRTVIKETEAVELPCHFHIADSIHQAGTSVQLRWRKDGKIIRSIEIVQALPTTVEPNKELRTLREDSRIVLSRQNGSLLLSNILASDAGQYMCQLHVEGFNAPINSNVGDLQVIEQLKFMPQPTSKNLELGTVGKVHCKAQGTPTPQVKWVRDLQNPQLPDGIDDINGTLVFKNVSNEHRGNYTCIAGNSQGGQIKATVSINVGIAPKFSVAPQGPIEVNDMGIGVMHCQAIGDPKPTIKWDKDLQYLSENNTDRKRFRFLDNGTLEIRDVHPDDEGSYGCTIGNSAGLKRQEVRFIVKSSADYVTEESSDGFPITRAVLITMSVAFAYIILVVGLMIWCRYRRQARKARLTESNKNNLESGEGGKHAQEHEPCLPENKIHNSSKSSKKMNGNSNPRGSGNEAPKSDDTACSNHSKSSKKSQAFDQLSLPRCSILELIQIGRGEFGDVFVGKIKGSLIRSTDDKDIDTEKQNGTESRNGSNALEKRRSKTSMDDIEEIIEEQDGGSIKNGESENKIDEFRLVLVKALNKVKDEHACQEFRRQIELFRALSHKGVVHLFGLCRDKDPHYMVLEYTDWGDLKQFLLATAGKVNTSSNDSSPPPLKTAQILAVAYQVARGMDAIYRARFIHKDLAARNCVISSDFVVKVSYPALCKDKYSREYCKHRNGLLPVRWLAPECIDEDDYTTKSDIFAYGVFIWELFNQATKIPFEELSNEEYIQRSLSGKLVWECETDTPDCLKETLQLCWSPKPKERPSFSQICSALSKAIQNGDK